MRLPSFPLLPLLLVFAALTLSPHAFSLHPKVHSVGGFKHREFQEALRSAAASRPAHHPPAKPAHEPATGFSPSQLAPGRFARFNLTTPSARIAVVSLALGLTESKLKAIRENHMTYCARHGYAYVLWMEPYSLEELRRWGIADPHWVVVWSKFLFIRDLLASGAFDFVFQMDFDSVFVDMEKPLQVFIDPPDVAGADLVFSGDLFVTFNNGHFMLRRSAYADTFISRMLRSFPNKCCNHDNSASIFVLSGRRPECRHYGILWGGGEPKTCNRPCIGGGCYDVVAAEHRPHVRSLPQSAMNSYGQLQPGQFILHAAGITTSKWTLVADWAKRVRRWRGRAKLPMFSYSPPPAAAVGSGSATTRSSRTAAADPTAGGVNRVSTHSKKNTTTTAGYAYGCRLLPKPRRGITCSAEYV